MNEPSGRSWLVEEESGVAGLQRHVVVYLPGVSDRGDWFICTLNGGGRIIRFDREVRAERDTHLFASGPAAVVADPDSRQFETRCGVVASKFAVRAHVTCRECLEAADGGIEQDRSSVDAGLAEVDPETARRLGF